MKNLNFIVLNLTILFAAFTLASCGKSIQPENRSSQLGPIVPACTDAQTRRWHYVQPAATVEHAVDLLFVVDTSASLDSRRVALATAIPDFLDHLPGQTDTRIGVMLAHGGASDWSGKLFAPQGAPSVIRVNEVGRSEAERLLEANLGHPVVDADEANGEAMMFSLTRSLEATRFAEIQAQGFYRPDAALSVVFVTDENDVCFDPRQHGYAGGADYKPSGGGIEDVAFARYCTGIDPASTRAALDVHFSGKLTLAGILHTTPENVPVAGEEAIGHGILELLDTLPDSLPLDLGVDYRAALSKLATTVSSHLDLWTSFAVRDALPLIRSSILVQVDGHAVTGQLDPQGHVVQIHAQDAGGAGSLIDITACTR